MLASDWPEKYPKANQKCIWEILSFWNCLCPGRLPFLSPYVVDQTFEKTSFFDYVVNSMKYKYEDNEYGQTIELYVEIKFVVTPG